MGPEDTERIIVAAQKGVADRLRAILDGAGLCAAAICHTAKETAAAAQAGAIVLCGWQLEDVTGPELAKRLGADCDVLMIVPQDCEETPGENVVQLRNPVSQEALVQSIRTLIYSRKRMRILAEKVERLSRTLEERKIIDRAKGRLIDMLHLTEREAHYQIQKKSMDSGRRISDIAREILDAEDIGALWAGA